MSRPKNNLSGEKTICPDSNLDKIFVRGQIFVRYLFNDFSVVTGKPGLTKNMILSTILE